MKGDIFEKAKKLRETIGECNDLLKSKKDSYYWCAVSVHCGNSNAAKEHDACIPREIWDKMLDALEAERDRLAKEFEAL